MPVGDFLGGFLNAFGQTSIAMKQMKKDQEERKLQAKLYEIQLEKAAREAQQAQAVDAIFQKYQTPQDDLMGGMAIPAQGAIGTRQELQQPGVLDQLAAGRTNQMMREMAVALRDPKLLMDLEKQDQEAQWKQAVLSQMQGGMQGGMQPSGMTIGADGNPSLSFQVPEYRYIDTPEGQVPYDPRNPPGVLPRRPQLATRKMTVPGIGDVEVVTDLANPGLPSSPTDVQFPPPGGPVGGPQLPDGAIVTKPEGYEDPIEKQKREREAEKSKFDRADKLRDEFNTQTKDYDAINQAYGRIFESSKNPSAAGDVALIFSFMRMLDPASTVREGEFATAQNSGGIPDKIRAAYNKAINGERLSDEQRTDFLAQSKRLYSESTRQFNSRVDEYTKKAEQFGIDPNMVITNKQMFDPDTGYTQEDLQFTADKYGITVEEVKRRLKGAP